MLAGSRPAAVSPVLAQSQPGRSTGSPYARFWQSLEDVDDQAVITKAVRFVALCSRVSWSCHTAGGSDAPVHVPDILAMLPPVLDPEPVLDMFDSESEFEEDLADFSDDA